MRYRFLNQSLLNQVGKTLEDHVGKKMSEVYPGIEESEVYGAILACHESGERQRVLNEFAFEDGRITYWELEIEKVENDVVIFSRDVTESVKGEKLLRESNKRLEQTVALRTSELEKHNKRMKQVVGHVAHDLRNYLSIIYTISKHAGDNNEYNAELMDVIYNSSNEALNIVYAILEDAALGAGKIKLNKKSTVVSELLQSRIEVHRFVGDFKDRTVQINLSETFECEVDPSRIIQVFDNLILNAVNYSPQDSTIEFLLDDTGLFILRNVIDYDKTEKAHALGSVKKSVGFGIEIVNSILGAHSFEFKVQKKENLYETTIHFVTLSEK